MTRLAIVIPAFNEEANISPCVARVRAVLDGLANADPDLDWTITFVDDGSRDGTVEQVRAEHRRDQRIRCLALSRNFGKEIAIAAGLSTVKGDAVVVMDADLQHPPETIPAFVEAWRGGAQVALGRRIDPPDASAFRHFASALFYRLFRVMANMRLEAGTVDFVLLDRKAVDALNRFGERARFTKGLFHWIGFRAVTVDFDCGHRVNGTSHYSLRRLLHFATDGIISFSSLPLRIWSWVGAGISASSILYGLYFLIRTLLHGTDVPGFPTLVVALTFLSGIQLLSLGVIGEYLSRIYEEAKARPLFLVREDIGAEVDLAETRRDRAA